MYILKIKGSARIPDYIQIRDNDFTLIAYFRSDRPEHALKKLKLQIYIDSATEIFRNLPYGKIQKTDFI
jgi:hypothetical protein